MYISDCVGPLGTSAGIQSCNLSSKSTSTVVIPDSAWSGLQTCGLNLFVSNRRYSRGLGTNTAYSDRWSELSSVQSEYCVMTEPGNYLRDGYREGTKILRKRSCEILPNACKHKAQSASNSLKLQPCLLFDNKCAPINHDRMKPHRRSLER